MTRGVGRLTIWATRSPSSKRQRVDKNQPPDPLARQFRRPAQHHAAGTGAGHHDIVQILIEQQFGDLGGVGLDGDPRPQLMPPIGAAVERGGIDEVPAPP